MAILVIFVSIVITLVTAVSALYLTFKVRYRYWESRGIPFIKPVIPFGIKATKDGKPVAFHEILGQSYSQFKGNTPFAGIFIMLRPIVIAIDLEFIQNVLVRDFSVFHDRGVYCNERDDPLSAHLFTLSGKRWKRLRTKLTPTFTSGKMKFMYPTIAKVGNELSKTLNKLIESENVFEIKDLCSRYTTDIIGTCAFGIECNSLKDPNCEFREAGRKAVGMPRYGFIGRILITQFPELAKKLHMKTVRPGIEEFFMKVVKETVDYREKNAIRRNDFMDLLIQLKNEDDIKEEYESLTFKEIVAQVFLFFLAGFETSSTTMSFVLYEMALNPDMQEKARHEINAVFEKYNGEFTYEAMKELHYIDQIIYESLRKYPPVSAFMRKACKEYRVPNTNIVIEKDTTVFIPVFSIHHDPKIYPEPEKFDPDRFRSEEAKNRHPMTFLGFGDGPRVCIGSRFGEMQTRVGLVALLQNFRFKTCSRTPVPIKFAAMQPILSSEGGIWLEIEQIKSSEI